MDAEGQESFREFVAGRASALLKTAVLLSGGDRHAAADLLLNALIKAADRVLAVRRRRNRTIVGAAAVTALAVGLAVPALSGGGMASR